MVDYTNCKYTEAYFDKKIDDVSISRLFRQDYTERIKKILSVVTEENANSRMKMLAPLKSYKSGKVLIEFIESKKDAFNETWNGTQIVENLLALPEEGEFTVLLKDEMENLKKYFYENLLHQRNERADERATTQNDSINLFAENQAENANSDTSIFFENVKLFVQKTAYPLIAVVILLV
ncbi:MAG: hypothetical protein LBB41_01220, partial [Prevotellaceae bacterium]|nr:hypothetical protein [Prevotellaceae bacterium]